MNRRRKLLIPLLFCGAMLIACDDKSAENAAAMTPEVGVVTLSPGSVNVLSELPGRTVPYEVAEIRPQVGGIIIKRNFIEGDKVNQGDSLYQIDPAPLQAELNSAKGSLAKALSTASNARITFNRQASLLKTNYVSRQDYDTARTQLNEAEANVTVAKAAVEQATINLQYANVTSPITGVSGKSSVTVGALVTAKSGRFAGYRTTSGPDLCRSHAVGARFLTHERRGRQWANQTGSGQYASTAQSGKW